MATEEKTLTAAMSGRLAKLREMTEYSAIAEQREKEYHSAIVAAARQGTKIYVEKIRERSKADRDANSELEKTQGLLGGIESLAMKWGGVQSAVNLATQAIREHVLVAEDARRRLMDMKELRIELGQVSKPGEDLQGVAKGLTKYGLSEKESSEFVLQAQNLGFADKAEYFAKNKAGIGDLRSVAEVVGMLPNLADKSLTPEQALAMTFAGANPSKLTPGQMSPIVARYGQSAQAMGTSADEVVAWASVMSQRMPTPETGAQWFGTFSTKLSINEDDRVHGKGMMSAIKGLRDMPEEQRKEILKRDTETNALYQEGLKALPEVEQRMKEVTRARELAGTPEGLVEQTTRRNLGNKSIAIALNATGKEEERKQAEEARFGERHSGATIARDELRKALHDKDANAFSMWFAERGMDFSEHVLGQTDPRRTLTVGAGIAEGFFGPRIDIEGLPSFKGQKTLEDKKRRTSNRYYRGEPGTGTFAPVPPENTSWESPVSIPAAIGEAVSGRSDLKDAARSQKEAAESMKTTSMSLTEALGRLAAFLERQEFRAAGTTMTIQGEALRPLT